MDEQSDTDAHEGSGSSPSLESSQTSASDPGTGGGLESNTATRRVLTPPARVPERGFVRTVHEAFRWLLGLPVLFIAFVMVDLAGTAVLVTEPLLLIGWVVLPFFVGGIAYHYADRRLRNEESSELRAFLSSTASVFAVLGSLVTIALVYVSLIVAVPVLVAAGIFAIDWLVSGVGVPFPYSTLLAIAVPLAVVPALYLAARLSLAFPACVLERQATAESLAISWDASDGAVFKLLGVFCVQLGGVAGIWLFALAVGRTDALLSPVVLVPLAPVHAGIMGTAQLALARIYLERRPTDAGGRPVAHPMDRREPTMW